MAWEVVWLLLVLRHLLRDLGHQSGFQVGKDAVDDVRDFAGFIGGGWRSFQL